RKYIDRIFESGCGCSGDCFGKISSFKEQAYIQILRLREYTKSERDVYILSKLEDQLITTDDNINGGKRQRQRFHYCFQGVEICESTWRSLFEIGRSEFKNLKMQLKENGATPRVHGLVGKKSNHGHPFAVVEAAILFLKRYADQFGLPLPAAPRARDNTPPVLLPCSESKMSIHMKYKEACLETGSPYMELTTFKGAWNSCVPYIQFIKPKTDLCKTCHDLREDISGAFGEEVKLQLTQRLLLHVKEAKRERDFYKLCTENARVELKHFEKPHGKFLQPCSMPFTNVHYTFDFSQYVTVPHSSQQVGALFFLQSRRIQIFGVCDENFPMQTNYLIDENETIGINGSKTHGPNAVLKMVHHYLNANSYGEIACHLHADNCVGQNKNKTTLHYLAWRCCTGRHKEIQLHFMIAGHTKCLCDSCFGMIKKKFRRSEVNGIQELEAVVENSAKCNTAVRYGGQVNGLQWFGWDTFFNAYFKPLKGIGKFHHFRFSAEEPGVVYARNTLEGPEVRVNLLKEKVNIDKVVSGFPEVIAPAGLSVERRNYLFNEIRAYVKAPYKDVTCPAPDEE
ncbi:uncharacterized protein LOC134276644, partial [Saccostrea cucullata]|uniref:uncharacterized protein LOC134276644 n=1 Tax=Saccostrea cuccullata TaxID=36930 RepID=UPI002ED692D3